MQQELVERLNELAPLVVEFERLTAAAAALERLGQGTVGSIGFGGSTRDRAPRNGGTRRRRGRPAGSETPRRTVLSATPVAAPDAPEVHARRGKARRKPANTRGIQAVALITEKPGITIPELAVEMKMNRTAMYRILPGPEMEGKIRREGNRWWPGR